jgi:hypothetical protein
VLKPQNYSTTPAIKAWRPPVPEPLPPAPLLGPKELLGLGALVLLQVWGWLNGRPKASVEIPPHTGTTITGTVPPSGNTVGASLTIVQPAGTKTIYGFDCQNPTTSSAIAQSVTLTNVKGVSFLKKGSKCGGVPTQLVWVIEHTDYRGTNERNILLAGNGIVSFNAGFQLTWNHPSAVPYEPDVEALPLPDGFVVPQVEPTADPDELSPPPPLPLPAPSTVPQVEPEVQPEVAPVTTDTTTIPLPQVVRTTTTVTTQQKLPGAVTTQNGALPAATPSPVPTTDPGSIIPWPGAAPIPGNGPAPAPTLDGIAQEVGRIERKIEMMMSPSAPGNLVNQLGDLADLIGPIVGAILAAGSGTVYTLDSPCEVDEATGEKLPPVQVEAPGGLTQFGAVLNRIDALAQLIQVHKNLRQPNCKPKQPTGEFVTVNFEQID